MVIELKLLMDKQVLNNFGYTMIEMIFVLSITCILASLALNYHVDLSSYKFRMIKELCYQAQFDSYYNKKVNLIEIFDQSLYINDTKYDLYPLTCDSEIFHYNVKGNIDHPFTLICRYKKDYEYRFQLGSGWIAYEE